mmetsp:Transcript_29618/g.90624  ORF Transcript_29618/g.90624 Transcript_29618/m.90624 type:complete len:167 (+) Transcript_29618:444-944(+)
MDVADGASAWNQSGTFEEKNHTTYAKKWLRDEALKLMVDLPPRQLGAQTIPQFLTITDVTDVRGDASTATARGKKKHFFDLAFTLKWQFSVDDGVAVASGSAAFPDVTGDAVLQGDPLDCHISVDSNTPQHAHALVQSYVKHETTGLRPAVLDLCKAFLDDFTKSK